ncbi:MAG TPA: elongation factor G [Anaerolineae bacterium]|nr:elongation factor G [Anaerolineae bacterium]HQI85362.1 elongation factor G [Anaerolineae bacterium]
MTEEHSLANIRNIGIIAHIDAGKTTTTERILYYTGRTHRLGNVDEGTTVTDWMVQERERGITIASAAVTCFWRGYQINIVDTPGHIDFTAEVQRSLRVLDGGIVVFDGTAGVEPQSETVWRQARMFGVPLIAFINKMDKLGANFSHAIETIRERLKAHPLPIQWPLGAESGFRGAVDLLEWKAVIWADDLGMTMQEAPVPADVEVEALAAREAMIETIVETDDGLMERYLDGEDISVTDLRAALRKATISGVIQPVLCGSSLRNKGVQPLLDAVVDFLPSPLDIPPVKGTNPKKDQLEERPADSTAPLAALIFKIAADPYVGRLAYFRVYSGKIIRGNVYTNPRKGVRERVTKLLRMFADHREEVEEVGAGDIGATVGLKSTFTGDTLSALHAPIVLETIRFPEPVISVAVEPRTVADQDRLNEALQRLAEEDPTFRVRVDEGTGQTVISGMGELHLEILVDRMLREFTVQANVGKLRVSYKETVTRTGQADIVFERMLAGKPQYARVALEVSPADMGGESRFENLLRPQDLAPQFVEAIRAGALESLDSGFLAGYPLVGVVIRLVGADAQPDLSSEIAFKAAAAQAFRQAVESASPVLLEPVMDVEVLTPEEFVGEVLGNLSSRDAEVQMMEARPGGVQAIRAYAPLIKMFGYATGLRSMTQGRGTFTMEFHHYAPVDSRQMEAILYGA